MLLIERNLPSHCRKPESLWSSWRLDVPFKPSLYSPFWGHLMHIPYDAAGPARPIPTWSRPDPVGVPFPTLPVPAPAGIRVSNQVRGWIPVGNWEAGIRPLIPSGDAWEGNPRFSGPNRGRRGGQSPTCKSGTRPPTSGVPADLDGRGFPSRPGWGPAGSWPIPTAGAF